MRINRDQLSSAVGIVFGALIVIHAFSYDIGSLDSPNTGFFPLLQGMAIIALSLIGLIAGTTCTGKPTLQEPLFKGKRWERPLLILLSLLAYAFVVKYVGFTITTMAFLSCAFTCVERIRLSVAVLISAMIAMACYVTFVVLLGAQLPKGVVGF